MKYCHLLTEQHEILVSNRIPSESFYPGSQALNILENRDRQRLLSLLPGLAQSSVEHAYGLRARRVLSRKEVRSLHKENALTAVSGPALSNWKPEQSLL
ncbi:hypothetical protein [Leisingera sp. ANG-DT]|uniref:hypothetical protein n=1 Tax=Leisingera sp. ANG-DT TaxID=1577897 RepID=UPI00187C0789